MTDKTSQGTTAADPHSPRDFAEGEEEHRPAAPRDFAEGQEHKPADEA